MWIDEFVSSAQKLCNVLLTVQPHTHARHFNNGLFQVRLKFTCSFPVNCQILHYIQIFFYIAASLLSETLTEKIEMC